MLAKDRGCWLVIAAAIALGCNDVVKDTNDLTLPGVVLEVRGPDGRFHPATEATFEGAFTAGHALELSCTVTDPGGVSRATLAFRGKAEACAAPGEPPAPADSISLTGLPEPRTIGVPDDGSDAASDRLVVTASLPGGIGCHGHRGAARFEGVPRGQRVEVRCTGENWSANPSTRKAQRILEIELP